jgi:hypothetical protein
VLEVNRTAPTTTTTTTNTLRVAALPDRLRSTTAPPCEPTTGAIRAGGRATIAPE